MSEMPSGVEVALTLDTEQATEDLRKLEEQAKRTKTALQELNQEIDRLRGHSEVAITGVNFVRHETSEVFLD